MTYLLLQSETKMSGRCGLTALALWSIVACWINSFELRWLFRSYMVMAYIDMAYIDMAYIVMAYIVMCLLAYIVMAFKLRWLFMSYIVMA